MYLSFCLSVYFPGVGFGIGNSMNGADIWLGEVISGHTTVRDSWAFTQGVPSLDTANGGTNDVLAVAGSEEGGQTTIKFIRKLVTGDVRDKPITDSMMTCVSAYQKGMND